MLFRKSIISLFLLLLIALLPGVVSGQDNTGDAYAETIHQADKYFAEGDYIKAKTSYQYATRLKPEEAYPKDRLRETIDKLREKMALMEQYTALITQADELFRDNEFDAAIKKYEEAGKMIPSEGYPQEKIEQIEAQKSAHRKLQVAYDDAIYRAEKYEKYKKYEEAKTEYEKAHEVFPDEPVPAQKIGELTQLIAEVKKARELYDEIIANADRLFNLKYYENAKQEYQKASEAKPDEAYPQAQIKEIETLLVKKNEYDGLVEAADENYMNKNLEDAKSNYQAALKIYPSESYPKDMIDKINNALLETRGEDDVYAESIQQADAFLAAKDYTNALKEYENASAIKPSESYPKDKIAEINSIQSSMEADESNYQLAIKLGDQYFAGNDFENAKKEYQKALNIKADAEYPADQLALANKALKEKKTLMAGYDNAIAEGDARLEEGKYAEARNAYQNALETLPGDVYATGQIEKADRLEKALKEKGEQYVTVIAAADKFFAEGNYQEARNKYNEALNLDETQSYPKEKLTEIETLLAQQRELENNYARAIASADLFMGKEEYEQALKAYQEAQSIKPAESYPQQKIAEINSLFREQADAETQYQETIKEAEGLMALKQYDKAKLAFMKAGNMKPGEAYPRNKIDEIETLIAQAEAQQAEYNQVVGAADRLMDAEDFDKARERYEQALEVIPGSQYPLDQIEKINNIILANELAVQESYNQLIDEADALFASQSYAEARLKYKEALKFKPGEDYPVQKLSEIERAMNDLEMLQTKYNKLVNEADRLFTSKDYQAAKEKYREASVLFPEEIHPKDRIEEINLIFRAASEKNQEAYDKAIAEADKFLAGKEYDQAINAYRNAQSIMPDENYPQSMIDKILSILEANAQRKILNSTITILNNEQEKFSFDPVSAADSKSSILHIRARGMAVKEFKVTVSYGKGGSKNGGYVLPIPPGSESREFIIPLGNQYTWYSENNNWISLTPQGGTVEVELIEITRGE
ncbi:MAG: hypothetical protein KDC05_06515 [Bacteroidales bacterium]|nr:hypothetical protein [Bacteroidales bacterium]